MYEIFEKLMKEFGYTAYKVSVETGIAQSTLSDWKKGKSIPKIDKIQKIADLFHVSVDYLMTGEEKEGGKYKKAIVADIFEALMGAIYLDLGYATARKTVLKIIVPYIEDPNVSFFSDYKSALQEYVQTEQKGLTYELVSEDGPAHERVFTVEVKVDDIVYGVGVGGSKKEAEQEAAKAALLKLAV